MHIRIKLGWIIILLQWIAAQARREENTQPFQRRTKKGRNICEENFVGRRRHGTVE